MKKCDCDKRLDININSWGKFQELKEYYESGIVKGLYVEIPICKPHYIGYDGNGMEIKWYADKWYKCKKCGMIWEFVYPDFPAKGYVKKIL